MGETSVERKRLRLRLKAQHAGTKQICSGPFGPIISRMVVACSRRSNGSVTLNRFVALYSMPIWMDILNSAAVGDPQPARELLRFELPLALRRPVSSTDDQRYSGPLAVRVTAFITGLSRRGVTLLHELAGPSNSVDRTEALSHTAHIHPFDVSLPVGLLTPRLEGNSNWDC